LGDEYWEDTRSKHTKSITAIRINLEIPEEDKKKEDGVNKVWGRGGIVGAIRGTRKPRKRKILEGVVTILGLTAQIYPIRMTTAPK